MNVKKLDRDATLEMIDFLKTRIAFNNELNKKVRKFMKERGLDDWHKFNGYHDEATLEMKEFLNDILSKETWMPEKLKEEYMSYCAAIFGQVYSPAVNEYIRNDLHDCERHLAEIERAAQARTEDCGEFTVKRDLESNRMNLYFDYIPEAEIRALLKSNGFKWSPYLEAWTRQLTDNAEKSLERIKKAMGL